MQGSAFQLIPRTNARHPRARVIVIVIDSLGVGALPDAALYGDEGSNTLGNIAAERPLRVPNLQALGISRATASRDWELARHWLLWELGFAE